MAKITFMGAGSAIFAKNVLGDSMLTEPLHDAHIALYDIDPGRLDESLAMLEVLNKNINEGRATLTAHCGVENRKDALKDADYVVNAIQVGGYEPSTVIDFEIPKKYGLRQTIGDTLGIGGIFRALRTIPVMLDFVEEMEDVCPDAWLLNYTNPMSMLTGAMLRGSFIRTVGLCHSVQVCADELLKGVGMQDDVKHLQWLVAGVNHQGWLLEITDGGKDIYPEIRKLAEAKNEAAFADPEKRHDDMVRFEIMKHFGYYVTESSEHLSEYVPWFIKSARPELIEKFKIPLDEYPRRCVEQNERWATQAKDLTETPDLTYERSHEYASYIMEAMETDVACRIGGNVMNDGLISNLPDEAVVEVPCMVDRNGMQGCYVGDLPTQCAALNQTMINVQLMTIEAAFTGSRDAVYQAAMLDPHTAAELTLDEIRAMCDELIEAHGDYLSELA